MGNGKKNEMSGTGGQGSKGNSAASTNESQNEGRSQKSNYGNESRSGKSNQADADVDRGSQDFDRQDGNRTSGKSQRSGDRSADV